MLPQKCLIWNKISDEYDAMYVTIRKLTCEWPLNEKHTSLT